MPAMQQDHAGQFKKVDTFSSTMANVTSTATVAANAAKVRRRVSNKTDKPKKMPSMFSSRRSGKVRPSFSTVNSAIDAFRPMAGNEVGGSNKDGKGNPDETGTSDEDSDFAWYEAEAAEKKIGVEFTQATTMNGLNHTTVGPLGCRYVPFDCVLNKKEKGHAYTEIARPCIVLNKIHLFLIYPPLLFFSDTSRSSIFNLQ